MSSSEVELCILLVAETFGTVAENIVTCLLRQFTQPHTLRALVANYVSSTQQRHLLAVQEVRCALQVLMQHCIVYTAADTQQPAAAVRYAVDTTQTLRLLRFPRYILLVREYVDCVRECHAPAATLVHILLSEGLCECHTLLERALTHILQLSPARAPSQPAATVERHHVTSLCDRLYQTLQALMCARTLMDTSRVTLHSPLVCAVTADCEVAEAGQQAEVDSGGTSSRGAANVHTRSLTQQGVCPQLDLTRVCQSVCDRLCLPPSDQKLVLSGSNQVTANSPLVKPTVQTQSPNHTTAPSTNCSGPRAVFVRANFAALDELLRDHVILRSAQRTHGTHTTRDIGAVMHALLRATSTCTPSWSPCTNSVDVARVTVECARLLDKQKHEPSLQLSLDDTHVERCLSALCDSHDVDCDSYAVFEPTSEVRLRAATEETPGGRATQQNKSSTMQLKCCTPGGASVYNSGAYCHKCDTHPPTYAVNMRQLYVSFVWCIAEQVVTQCFGARAASIYRLVRSCVYVEQETVHQRTMVEPREAKLLAYRLHKAGFLGVCDLRTGKHGGGASDHAAKVNFLFTVDYLQTLHALLQLTYRSLLNLVHVRQRNERSGLTNHVMVRRERLECVSRALNEGMQRLRTPLAAAVGIGVSERELGRMGQAEAAVSKLGSAETQLDETLFILQSARTYHWSET